MTELKPCPFCGGKAILKIGDRCVWVECECCGGKSSLHSALNSNAINAIKMVCDKWNRRTDNGTV